MNDQLREIQLYGVAGTRYGRTHRLAVRSPREAIRALCAVVPGFKQFLAASRRMGLTFAVFIGKSNLAKDQLDYPAGREPIRIAPVLVGSKRGGLFQTILGVALVAVGVFTQMPTLIGLGASMALGGVVQMLSPQTSGLAGVVNNGTSYYFNGPVNSAAQGEPVPLVYGRMLVGSKVISSGIYAEDQT
ncbi:putative phage tail protein [Paraburkholderia bannensis]|uniref:Putative phage tail protein n=1 Tax=Paraburkholderia bannensis TaxID=765414 RepID=A0A7W9U3E7_9BURK|nr:MULTISPECIES: tail assembly protein [Paraburkholderia]MBB3260009.1 putative phage tail protein [Paraburkholderia sp. WP4_3_2]MBB6105215.1 putative phage tail protein [Paraburkholderia bannensis]